jgi:hypothetical protein
MEDPLISCWKYMMFQTSENSQLLRRVLWINAELTIVWSLKHKKTQPSYIFNRETPQNSEPQNGPRRGLDFIALNCTSRSLYGWIFHLFRQPLPTRRVPRLSRRSSLLEERREAAAAAALVNARCRRRPESGWRQQKNSVERERPKWPVLYTFSS